MLSKLFQKTATVCGHSLARKGVIKVGDKEIEVKRPKNAPTHCYECTSEKSILCAYCEELIIPGNPITITRPLDEKFVLPEHAVWHNELKREVVGCLRWDCADSGAFYSGHWTEEGVKRQPSPIELAMQTGKPVIVGDTSDPSSVKVLDDD